MIDYGPLDAIQESELEKYNNDYHSYFLPNLIVSSLTPFMEPNNDDVVLIKYNEISDYVNFFYETYEFIRSYLIENSEIDEGIFFSEEYINTRKKYETYEFPQKFIFELNKFIMSNEIVTHPTLVGEFALDCYVLLVPEAELIISPDENSSGDYNSIYK